MPSTKNRALFSLRLAMIVPSSGSLEVGAVVAVTAAVDVTLAVGATVTAGVTVAGVRVVVAVTSPVGSWSAAPVVGVSVMAIVGVRAGVTVGVIASVGVDVSVELEVEASVGAVVGVVICPNWADGRCIGSASATGKMTVAGASMVNAKVRHANDRIVSNRCIDIPSCNTLVHYAAC